MNRLKPYVKNGSLIASLLFSSNPCVHVPKGLNDIHDLDLCQLVHSRAPSWYGDSLQAFLPRGFTTLPWPEPLPLLSIEPLLDPIQRRRPTMQDCWWRDGPTNTWCFIVFFCGFYLGGLTAKVSGDTLQRCEGGAAAAAARKAGQ